jgi:DNA-binding transcriptional LysR family regulator
MPSKTDFPYTYSPQELRRGESAVDLLQLRYFQAVARHEHVSRAAEELRVAQPALSRSIARLEAELGVALFDRRGRRVTLNRFGAAFGTRVAAALSELDQARSELHDAAGLAHGSVAVAAETLRTITDLIAAFLAEHPDVSFRLFQSSAPNMSAQLQAGEADLCFASQPVQAGALESAELFREEVLLCVPPAHRLAGRGRVTIEDLAGEPFVTTRPGYWVRALADRLFADSGHEPPAVACEGDEPSAIRGLISAGVGIGLLPRLGRQAPHPPVAWLHLDAPGCQRTLSVVWRRDAYLSAAARGFRDFAVSHFRRSGPAPP